MCRNCSEGSILSNGFCDMCGFNELRFVEEWEAWSEELDAQARLEEDYEAYAFQCEVAVAIVEALEKAA